MIVWVGSRFWYSLYNIITLIAAEYIKELIKLKDFVELDVISDFIRDIIAVALGYPCTAYGHPLDSRRSRAGGTYPLVYSLHDP